MEYLIRKANGTTVRVSRDEYERILSSVADGERADKLADALKKPTPQPLVAKPGLWDAAIASGKVQRLPVAELGERRWGAE